MFDNSDSIATTNLLDEILNWLPDTSFDDLEEYYRYLPEDKDHIIHTLAPSLINSVRAERRSQLNKYFQTNIQTVLSEIDTLILIADLAQYGTQSVIDRYVEHHSELQLKLKSGVSQAEIVRWARKACALWINTFYFVTLPEYSMARLYLQSLRKAGISAASCKELHENMIELIHLLNDFFTENNFQPTQLSNEISRRIRTFLTSLTFLPEEFINQIVTQPANLSLYDLLDALQHTLQIPAILDPLKNPTDRELEIMLWEEMRQSREMNYLKQGYQISKIKTETNTEQLLAINNLLKPATIMSGKAEASLRQYISQASGKQKQKILDLIKVVVTNSPSILALLEPLDPEFLFARFKTQPDHSKRAEFIASFQSQFDNESWPYALKTMQLLATVF